MKKILALGLIACLSLSFSGCVSDTTTGQSSSEVCKEVEEHNTYGFTEVLRYDNSYVVYQNYTKVMYVVSDGGYNHGTYTLLVDQDGKPLIYKE